jgi:murein DD-endopeptidase MepM/ murein hydrolase activator NlpD
MALILVSQGCVWPKRRFVQVDRSKTVEQVYKELGLDTGLIGDTVKLDQVIAEGHKVYVPYERFQSGGNRLAELKRGRGRVDRSQSLIWPVQGGVVSSEFGYRWNRYHQGLDLVAPIGTPIHAAESGTVIYSANEIGGYGNMVVVKHAGGLSTIYAHNQKNLVGKGDKVSRGDKIALLGNSGKTTGAHLHFEVRDGSKPLDPVLFLPDRKKTSWADYVIK